MPSTKPDAAQQMAFLIGRLSESIDGFRNAVQYLEGEVQQLKRQSAVQHEQLQFLLKRTHDLNTTSMVLLKLLTNPTKIVVDGDGDSYGTPPMFTLATVQQEAAVYAAACAIDSGVRTGLIREARSSRAKVAQQAVGSVDATRELKN